MSRFQSLALALLIASSGANPGFGAPTLGSPFRDHAVLQRDKPLPIWGRGEPGERISVSFHGQEAETVAGADGRWSVVLAPLAQDAAGQVLSVQGKGAVRVQDVVLGDVWICSGQSNMEFTLNSGGVFRVDNADAEVAAARYPLIRQFKVAHQTAASPQDYVPGDWRPCTPATAAEFTAVGYFFARDLYRRTGVPMGIINCTWSGSPLEAWMSKAALAAFPGFTNGHPLPGAPQGKDDFWVPSTLFNGMVNPLLPYGIRGALWYQGESNVGRAALYSVQFPALISSWRSLFGQGDFPFLWVQLPGYAAADDHSGQAWAFLREAQSKALALPMTGQAVIFDGGDIRNIHPRDKQEVGRRLALIAKAKVYGIPVDYSGPVFRAAVPEGRALRVTFAFAGEGLTASVKALQSFEIAGQDRHFHRATAEVRGDSVLVWSPAVPQPVAVRYAWADAPVAELFNGAGLPAAPFRSDSW
jgi:sialate O-acetylesterase